MEQVKQTLRILVQAAEMGQAKGAYVLADAGVIAQAVTFANEYLENKEEPKPKMEVAEDEKEAKPKK